MGHPAAGQRRHGRPVADLLGPADERGFADSDRVEDDVGGPGSLLAHLRVLGADADARRAGGHQEHGDTGAAGPRFAGAGEHDEQVRQRGVGDEALLPVQDPVAAVDTGPGAARRRVRAGAGFGQRERGDDLAGGDALQPLLLLHLGAEVDQHLARDAVVGAEHRPQRQRGVPELHRELDVLPQVQPETAPFRRDRVAEQAHLRRGSPQVVRDAVRGHDLVLPRHDVVADEAPHLGMDVREVLVADLVAHVSRFSDRF